MPSPFRRLSLALVALVALVAPVLLLSSPGRAQQAAPATAPAPAPAMAPKTGASALTVPGDAAQKFIADGVADGSLVTAEPKIAEFFLIGALNWLPRWYSPGGRIGSEELATIFIRIVLDGLRGKAG